MRLWLGPFAWRQVFTSGGMGWSAPLGARVVFDLRTMAHASAAGPAALGHGLFVTPDAITLGGSYGELADTLGPLEKADIQTFLNLPDPVLADTRRDLLVHLLTRHADADGLTFARPLMPNRFGLLSLAVGGAEFEHRLATDSPYWLKIQRVYQEQYRAIRARTLAGEALPGFYRRWLGRLIRKLRGFDYRLFIPNDLPDEAPLEPATTITDSFNRADADPLGSSSEGWSWTEVNGDLDIVSNEAKGMSVATNSRGRAESDLSSDDHYAEIDMITEEGGPLTRYAAAADTCYWFFSDAGRIFKVVTGTPTELASSTSVAGPATMRLITDGSSLEGTVGGTNRVGPITDTAITGNTRCGLEHDLNGRTTAFTAADLTAPPVGDPPGMRSDLRQRMRPRAFTPSRAR